jgi:predicted ester cyclase
LGASERGSEEAREVSTQHNKALVRRLVDDVINAGDMDLLDELFVPGLVPRMRRLFGSFRSAFPDWQEEVVWLVAEGDMVAGRFRCRGTHEGEFLGYAPTGRRMEVDEVFSFRVEDGRFAEFWALEDGLSRMRQLGLIPASPASGGRRGGGG